jgi:hypothetical protein
VLREWETEEIELLVVVGVSYAAMVVARIIAWLS